MHLVHRGPDDGGSLVDGPVAFGFRRLSIIDLSTGHQPVPNEQRSVWVMFNGEIYNFVELREQLLKLGHRFETQSDTECIAHAYESYGLDFVHHLRGMFAIALWDSDKRRLVLARDRVGKKPLFYSVRDGELAFASEVKSFLAWPRLNRAINPKALHDYLTFLCVPAPDSIFQDLHKLPPAHMLVADCNDGSVSVHRYWSLPSAPPDRTKPVEYYAEGLREVVAEAVRLRLRSDVPLGAFLSGGIDSSITAGMMAREVSPVRTFSIGFPDKRFDETHYARLAAERFGTIHTEEIVDANNLDADEFVKLVWHMDEPFADSSFIPTYWVSKTARKHVTVALSGDGGDELFGGYTTYRYFQLLGRLRVLPDFVKSAGRLSAGALRGLATPLPHMSERLRKVQKAFELSQMDLNAQVLALLTYYDEASKAGLYSGEWRERVGSYTSLQGMMQHRPVNGFGDDPLDEVMRRDFETYMVDDIMVKVDRASMAVSLEARAPLLDQKVVEFAMGIPSEYKLHNGQHKIVLKQAFKDLLPQEITHRGKQGFEVPFAQWFQQGHWRQLLMEMLSEKRLRDQGIFDPKPVVALRDSFLQNPEAVNMPISAFQLRHRVWLLFAFQMWYDQFMNG